MGERKQELGLDKEDSGVFWMSWTDFTRLFAEVTVCRLRPDHLEARQGGWLPSIFGAGQAMEIEVYAHTQLELTLHQEAHANRGEGAISTLKDLGVAVLKLADQASHPEPGSQTEAMSLVHWGERMPHTSVSIDTTLESDGFTSRYLVVPLCFGHLKSPEPRKFAIAALSTTPLSLETVPLSPAQLAQTMIAVAIKHGDKTPLLSHPSFGEALIIYTLEDVAGWTIVAENASLFSIRVEVDASEQTSGFLSSRGALFCEDVLPPRTRQVLLVLSVDMSRKTHSMGLRFGGGALEAGAVVPPGAGHIPTLDDLGALKPFHEPYAAGASGGSSAAPPLSGGDVDVASLAAQIFRQMR